MKIYPYSSPIILNDSIYIQNGGYTGVTIPAVRTAAYLIAEQQMTTHIGTFLLPTNITGTWDYFPGVSYLSTDYGYVSNLANFKILDSSGNILKTLPVGNSYAAIHEDTFGYFYVQDLLEFCNYRLPNSPYKFQATYTAGLPTGVANQPSMLLALTGAAEINLNEMLDVSLNESTGDVGVEQFRSLDYSEVRKKWHRTAFGSSAKASWVAHLVDSTIRKANRAVMLGR